MLEVPFRPRANLNALALYGLIGFVAAAVIHFGTYAGRGLRTENPLFFLLHLGIFPLFFIFVFRLRAWNRISSGAFGLNTRSLEWRELLPYFPAWVIGLAVVAWVYVFLNFFLSVAHLPARGASDTVLLTRAFSGHWLVFYLLPALFFAYVPADARQR